MAWCDLKNKTKSISLLTQTPFPDLYRKEVTVADKAKT